MSIARNFLLWCSVIPWMKNKMPQYAFIQKAVKRFMPGEIFENAAEAAADFQKHNMFSIFTFLGENISNIEDAKQVADHYIKILTLIKHKNLYAEISVKLSQLGFDISEESTFENFIKIVDKAAEANTTVWIDMEGSSNTSSTIEFFKRANRQYDNTGICLQAYLRRTADDLEKLLPLTKNLRLVKGAYNEPSAIAFENKKDVDENYFKLAQSLVKFSVSNKNRIAFATHDEKLISLITNYANEAGFEKSNLEFQMLYGIKSLFQLKLAEEGIKIGVLISYGNAWFPWYMRRLAERPANIWFVLKNLFTR